MRPRASREERAGGRGRPEVVAPLVGEQPGDGGETWPVSVRWRICEEEGVPRRRLAIPGRICEEEGVPRRLGDSRASSPRVVGGREIHHRGEGIRTPGS